MMPKLRWLITAFLCVMLLLRSAAADTPAPPAQLRLDSRLDRPITVSRGRVYLGELLEELTRQSKVRLTLDKRVSRAGGIDLTVVLTRQPLRRVLTALEELLSHRYCKWEWRRANGSGNGYVLVAPTTFEGAADAARTAILSQWRRDLSTYLEIANLEEPDRSERAKQRPDLYPPSGFSMFDLLRRLRPNDVDNLLKGVSTPLDRSKLTAEESNALRLGVSGDDAGLAGMAGFYVNWKPDAVAPTLWVRSGSYSASTFGGMRWENPWLAANAPGWLQSTDPEVQSFRRLRSQGNPSAGSAISVSSLPDWAMKFAQSSGVNLIMDRITRSATTGWRGSNPEQTVAAFVLQGGLMAKKSGDIQLLRDRAAPVQARKSLVEWETIRSLRESAARNDGYLSLADLQKLSALQAEQLDQLAEEFPDAQPLPLTEWRPIFRFYETLLPNLQKRVTTTDGLPWREAGLVARACLFEVPDTHRVRGLALLEAQGRDASVSFRVEATKNAAEAAPPAEGRGRQVKPAPRRMVWEVSVPGQVLRRVFPSRPRQPLEPK